MNIMLIKPIQPSVVITIQKLKLVYYLDMDILKKIIPRNSHQLYSFSQEKLK